MDVVFPVFFLFFVIFLCYLIYQQIRKNKRSRYISEFEFPKTISEKVKQTYPHLSDREIEQVIKGLREYFHVINLSRRKLVSMPSQVIDVAWHEFILFTKMYQEFCTKALGRFLHHTPAEAMKSPTDAQDGIKRAWRIACFREQINPHKPKKLPLIFALDARLNIEDGFFFELDCMATRASGKGESSSGGYCGSHVGCSSGCAGSAGDGGCAGDSGGGGCGGD